MWPTRSVSTPPSLPAPTSSGIALISTPTTYKLQFSEGLDAQLAPSGAAFDIADDSPFAVALGRGTPIEIEWLPDFATHRAALVDAMVEAGLRSVAFVPMRGETRSPPRCAGVRLGRPPRVGARHRGPRAGTVVDVVTTSLQRGAAEETGRRRRAQADAMSTLAAELAGAVGPEAVWRIASRHVPTVFGASRISVARLADDESELLMTFVDDERSPIRGRSGRSLSPVGHRSRTPSASAGSSCTTVPTRSSTPTLTSRPRPVASGAASQQCQCSATSGFSACSGSRFGLDSPSTRTNAISWAFVGSLLGQAATRAQLFDRERARRRMIEAIQRASVDILAVHDPEPAHAIAQSATRESSTRLGTCSMPSTSACCAYLMPRGTAATCTPSYRSRKCCPRRMPRTLESRCWSTTSTSGALRYPDVDRFAGDPTLAVPLHDQTGGSRA